MSEATQVTVMLTADQIQARVREIAREIERDFPPSEDLHLVCVLKGAFMFLSDLVRALERPVSLDFMAMSSVIGERTVQDLAAGDSVYTSGAVASPR